MKRKSLVKQFSIPGPAPGKPRMTRRDKWAKRPCVLKYWAWCDLARKSAGQIPPAEKTLRVDCTAYYQPPPSWPVKKRVASLGQQKRTKPDRDNIEKALFDALWKNDEALAGGEFWRYWGEEDRLDVRIEYVQ